jgi:hypothetical protein
MRRDAHIASNSDTRENDKVEASGVIVEGVEVFGALALYFLPSIIADRRKRHDVLTIALFNACLGWTVLGWLVALGWSFQPNPSPDLADDITTKRRIVSMGVFSRGLVERVRNRSARASARDRGSK